MSDAGTLTAEHCLGAGPLRFRTSLVKDIGGDGTCGCALDATVSAVRGGWLGPLLRPEGSHWCLRDALISAVDCGLSSRVAADIPPVTVDRICTHGRYCWLYVTDAIPPHTMALHAMHNANGMIPAAQYRWCPGTQTCEWGAWTSCVTARTCMTATARPDFALDVRAACSYVIIAPCLE